MIVAFTLPAMGHVKPMMHILGGLISKGQRIVCYGHQKFKETILSSGAEFAPYPDIPFNIEAPDFNLIKMGADIIFASEKILSTLLPDIEALSPQLIIQDSMALWASRIGTALGIPRVHTIPTLVFNAETVQCMRKEYGTAKLVGDVICGVPSLLRAKISSRFNVSLQESFGLEKSWQKLAPPVCELVFNIVELQLGNPQGDVPRHYIGPAFSKPYSLESQPKQPEYAFITFGTLSNNQTERFEAAIRGAFISGFSVIAVCGKKVDLAHLKNVAKSLSTTHQDQTVVVFDHLPDIEAAISGANVVIHHAGMATTWETIRCRKPALFIPTISDQMILASQLESFGFGIRLPQGRELDPQVIAINLRKVLDGNYPWEKIETALTKAGGMTAGVSIILKVLEEQQ